MIQTHPESSVLKHKKNFKIWFSPRSRKVRCMVEKPSEGAVPESGPTEETAATQPDIGSAQPGDLSVFNFTSSSQDSGSSPSQMCKNENKKKVSTKRNARSRKMSVQGATRTTRKKAKEAMKNSRLGAINQQWGITVEVDPEKEKEQSSAERAGRSSKRVSFLSPVVTSDEPQLEVRRRNTVSENVSEDNTLPNDQTQPGQSMSDSVMQHDKLSSQAPGSIHSPDKHDKASPSRHSSKRCKLEEKVTTLETTPKRPRASPGRRRKSQLSPATLNPPSLFSPRCDKSVRKSREEQRESPSALGTVVQKSPSTPTASVGRPTSGSPAIVKRNHKGETLLHIASIKVEKYMNNSLIYFTPFFCCILQNTDLKPLSEKVAAFCMM